MIDVVKDYSITVVSIGNEIATNGPVAVELDILNAGRRIFATNRFYAMGPGSSHFASTASDFNSCCEKKYLTPLMMP